MGDDACTRRWATPHAGGGFLQPNTPTPGLLPIVPPGFPLLLAPLWFIAPAFPANVFARKRLLRTRAAAGLTYAYGRRAREVVASNWRWSSPSPLRSC